MSEEFNDTKVLTIGDAPSPNGDPAPGSIKVNLGGQELSLDDALRTLTVASTATRPRFDATKPRVVEPVPIELGGKTMHLRLPFWALKRFQKQTGVSPWDVDKIFSWPPDMDVTVAIIWAGLLQENPGITIEEVETLEGMEFANIHYLRRCLDECWGRNAPDTAPNGGTPDPN